MADTSDNHVDLDGWSWPKFFKGFFDGKNYAKSIVFLFCMLVIVSIIGAVAYTVMNLLPQKKAAQPQVINSSGGAVDTSTKKTWWSLFEVNFGGQEK